MGYSNFPENWKTECTTPNIIEIGSNVSNIPLDTDK